MRKTMRWRSTQTKGTKSREKQKIQTDALQKGWQKRLQVIVDL
jgi:hypothetical protein